MTEEVPPKNEEKRGEDPEEKEVFVGNFPIKCGDLDLRALFLRWGKVMNARIFTHKGTNKSKGVGIVVYDTHEQAKKAIEEGNGLDFEGMKIRVSWGGRELTQRQLQPRNPLPQTADANKPRKEIDAKEFAKTHEVVKRIDGTEARAVLNKMSFKDLTGLQFQLSNGMTSLEIEDLIDKIHLQHIKKTDLTPEERAEIDAQERRSRNSRRSSRYPQDQYYDRRPPMYPQDPYYDRRQPPPPPPRYY